MKLEPALVATREDMAAFVSEIRHDLLANPEKWENVTLERFLAALSSYIEDVPGYLENTSAPVNAEVPSWQLFATVLCGARVYE